MTMIAWGRGTYPGTNTNTAHGGAAIEGHALTGMFSLSTFPFFLFLQSEKLFGVSNNLNSKCQLSIRVEIFLFCRTQGWKKRPRVV